MKDVDPNSDQERFQRILNSKIITPADVGFLLGGGVRKFRSFLLDQAGKVFADGAVDKPALEDVVQGLLLTFESNRFRNFRGEAKLATFLITCVVNRVRKTFTELTKRKNSTQAISSLSPNHDALADASGCASKISESKDLQQHVIEQIKPFASSFVSSISLENRTLLRLRYEKGVEWKTIARILGCSEDAAKRRRDRIVEKLKAKVFPGFLKSILENTKDENLCTQILYRSIAMNQPYDVIAKDLEVNKKSVSDQVNKFSDSFLELISQPEYLESNTLTH